MKANYPLPTPEDTIKAAYHSCIDNLHDQSRSGNEIEACYHHDQALGTLLTELTCGTQGYIFHYLEYEVEEHYSLHHHSIRSRIIQKYLARWSAQLVGALINLAGSGETQ